MVNIKGRGGSLYLTQQECRKMMAMMEALQSLERMSPEKITLEAWETAFRKKCNAPISHRMLIPLVSMNYVKFTRKPIKKDGSYKAIYSFTLNKKGWTLENFKAQYENYMAGKKEKVSE